MKKETAMKILNVLNSGDSTVAEVGKALGKTSQAVRLQLKYLCMVGEVAMIDSDGVATYKAMVTETQEPKKKSLDANRTEFALNLVLSQIEAEFKSCHEISQIIGRSYSGVNVNLSRLMDEGYVKCDCSDAVKKYKAIKLNYKVQHIATEEQIYQDTPLDNARRLGALRVIEGHEKHSARVNVKRCPWIGSSLTMV